METESKKELLTLRPSLLNALVPELSKNLFYALIVGVALLLLYFILSFFKVSFLPSSFQKVLLLLAAVVAGLTFAPLLAKLIVLRNTFYHFYVDHVISEFKFFVVRRFSVPYSQIVNMVVEISIWDRLCRAGDIALFTAEDKHPDFTLKYIRNPQKIEQSLYRLMRKKTVPVRK